MESDTEKGSGDGASSLPSTTSPGSLVHAATEPSDRPVETPKPRIPKVTSDSFISELVSDREPAKTSRESRSAGPAVPEEETAPGDDEVKAPCAGPAVPLSQSGGPNDPQWSNVDLAEVQGQQAQAGAALDTADTCSLSSVATYTLAMEDPYGVDEHPLWAWVSGGGCSVDSHSQLNWFNCSVNSSCELNQTAVCVCILCSLSAAHLSLLSSQALVQSVQSMSLSVTPAQTAAWRRQIFEQLHERTKREMDNFRHYEQAIEQVMAVQQQFGPAFLLIFRIFTIFCPCVVFPSYLPLFFVIN